MIMDDNGTDVSENDKTNFTLINCNARSLCPKLESLTDCMSETEAAVGVVTETWMSEKDLDEVREKVKHESGLGMEGRVRKECAENGVTYGGVAVLWNESRCDLRRLEYDVGDFELLVCAGKVKGHSRKMVVIACYLPPGYSRSQGDQAMTKIEDIVVDVKRLSLIHI